MDEDEFTIESGILPVGNGHKIYYQRWGNPKADPIFYLHGGPGAGTSDKHKVLFDPHRHQIVFHDQRGCGKSTPFGKLENNTTQNLIADIEKLRKKFGFEKIRIAGGSWGSCLAFCYSLSHADRVEKLLLWGIFTGRRSEIDYIQQGGMKTHYPEAWEQYLEIVPKSNRRDTSKYYLNKMQHGSDTEKKEHVKRWVLLERSAATIDGDFATDVVEARDFDDSSRQLAILEAHYFVNNCFIEPDYILKNAGKLSSIPIVLVHGRVDHVCPPETAYELAKRVGDNCHLHFVPASHAREASLREALRAYAWSFLN